MTTAAEFDVAQAFVQVAQAIGGHEDVASTRQHIVRLAQSSLNCSGAAIWHLKGEHMALDAGTDSEFLTTVAKVIAQQADGPCWRALHSRLAVSASDLTADKRWPDYSHTMLTQTSIRSVMSFPLAVGENYLGVLSLYAETPGHFTEQLIDLGSVYAAHAALALEKAHISERADNLSKALESNRRIGMALGILMSQHKVTDEQAFDLLRVCSQHTHMKLHDVAEAVILTGAVVPWAERRPGDHAEFR